VLDLKAEGSDPYTSNAEAMIDETVITAVKAAAYVGATTEIAIAWLRPGRRCPRQP
jgi:hypothetical protein